MKIISLLILAAFVSSVYSQTSPEDVERYITGCELPGIYKHYNGCILDYVDSIDGFQLNDRYFEVKQKTVMNHRMCNGKNLPDSISSASFKIPSSRLAIDILEEEYDAPSGKFNGMIRFMCKDNVKCIKYQGNPDMDSSWISIQVGACNKNVQNNLAKGLRKMLR